MATMYRSNTGLFVTSDKERAAVGHTRMSSLARYLGKIEDDHDCTDACIVCATYQDNKDEDGE